MTSRHEGSPVYYEVHDQRTFELLELAKQLISATLAEGQMLLLITRMTVMISAGLGTFTIAGLLLPSSAFLATPTRGAL